MRRRDDPPDTARAEPAAPREEARREPPARPRFAAGAASGWNEISAAEEAGARKRRTNGPRTPTTRLPRFAPRSAGWTRFATRLRPTLPAWKPSRRSSRASSSRATPIRASAGTGRTPAPTAWPMTSRASRAAVAAPRPVRAREQRGSSRKGFAVVAGVLGVAVLGGVALLTCARAKRCRPGRRRSSPLPRAP